MAFVVESSVNLDQLFGDSVVTGETELQFLVAWTCMRSAGFGATPGPANGASPRSLVGFPAIIENLGPMRVHYQFLKVSSGSKLGCQCRGFQLVTVKRHSVTADAHVFGPKWPTPEQQYQVQTRVNMKTRAG